MSVESQSAKRSADRLRQAYVDKVRSELEEADRLMSTEVLPASSGDLFAAVMLVKGLPGPAELAGGASITGRDGEAAEKALEALGFDPGSTFRTVTRRDLSNPDEHVHLRLRLQVEAVDPDVIIALDPVAATDVAGALGIARLEIGVPVVDGGRVVLAVDGLEASLGDERRKRRVWLQLKKLAPRGPVW